MVVGIILLYKLPTESLIRVEDVVDDELRKCWAINVNYGLKSIVGIVELMTIVWLNKCLFDILCQIDGNSN